MLKPEDIKNIVDSVKYTISSVETVLDQKTSIESALEDYNKQLADFESRVTFLSDTKSYYVKAIDIIYEESIGALKETLNTALRFIISDKNYSCNLTLEDKRGTKNLYISICDNDTGLEVDWKHGCGQGVRAVLSFVLKAFYLKNQNTKILLLDEKYSTLSSAYIENFFTFMLELCKSQGFIVVMVTHDERFIPYATKTYLVNDGFISELKEENEQVGLVEEE